MVLNKKINKHTFIGENMIYDGLRNQKGHIAYANREDVCRLCAEKYAEQNNISIAKAEVTLRGKLNTKKVFQI